MVITSARYPRFVYEDLGSILVVCQILLLFPNANGLTHMKPEDGL